MLSNALNWKTSSHIALFYIIAYSLVVVMILTYKKRLIAKNDVPNL